MQTTTDKFNINYEYIVRYLHRTLKQDSGLLLEMADYAHKNDVPISSLESMRFIEVLLKIANAKKVLEVGCAIGYSAISMALCGAEVTSVERDENMYKLAGEYIKRSGVEDKINIIFGDAADVLSTLNETYDFIFLDAAKAQYQEFLPHCLRLLKKGGILYSDNILYKGMVATDELAKRRKITIIKRLRSYLDLLCHTDGLDTSIIPLGDGVAITIKEKDITL